ncbi:hypothetical protein C4572_03035 [Candidatus Parcubacteria bacterium]|nr:MAG: hypothetical protein C4572_03035 [Candidatus Parcubacteria bacterium]
MSQIFRKKNVIKLPLLHGQIKREEYGKALEGLWVCKRCRNVRFKKEWHHPGSKAVEELRIGERKGVKFGICPACYMITHGLFEGEIILDDVPKEYHQEIVNLVRSFGREAELRDPQDRIISLTRRKNRFRVATTENQLAVRLAKKIRETYKKAGISISHSREPYEVGRVRMSFPLR